jgi:hypothetical protein
MQAFLEFVVRNLVDYPDEVLIGVRQGEGKTTYDLRVNRSDVGKLVGKSGQTIDAIRSLVTAAGAQTGQRFQVEIVEEPRSEDRVPATGGSGQPKLSSSSGAQTQTGEESSVG